MTVAELPPPNLAVAANTKYFVLAVLACALITVSAIVTIAVFKPGDTSTGTLVLGVMGPITAAFLAAAVYGTYHATNSRLTELLELTRTSSIAEGRLQGPEAK